MAARSIENNIVKGVTFVSNDMLLELSNFYVICDIVNRGIEVMAVDLTSSL